MAINIDSLTDDKEVILTEKAVGQLIKNIQDSDDDILQSANTYAAGLGSNYDPIGAATTAENNAKAYADGLADDYATAAQGALADSALQVADITSGSTTGAIAVKGTSVSVYGLGSAAYTNASAYDVVGAAAAVQAVSEPKKITGVLRIPFATSATSAINIIKYYTTLANATNNTSPQDFPESFGSKTIIISPANDTAWTVWRDNGIRCSGQANVVNNAGGLTFSLDDAFSSNTATYANIIIFD